MKAMSGMLADAYAACLSSVATCCAPLADRVDRPSRAFSEKQSFSVLQDQPAYTPAPYYDHAGQGQVPWEPEAEAWSARRRDRMYRRASENRAADIVEKTRSSLRRRFRSTPHHDMRCAQISTPYNFRHLHGESYQFSQYTSLRSIPQLGQQEPCPFRPIELSIHANTERCLSPLLPEFEMITLSAPPPAQLPRSRPGDFDLTHERSYSNMSFHIPRRHTGGSPATTFTDSPPRIPPKSRARAHTSPSVEQIKERIAQGLNEMEALQREIESVIERQSIYAPSSRRASTVYSTGPFDLEPMPDIPALPPAAPSFSERLTPGGERANTAPMRPPRTPPQRAINGVGPAAAFITPPPSREREVRGPPPPLPLVLRPPLRKKKSFSRVSSWLFPGQADRQHEDDEEKLQRDASLDSVTNVPRPIKGRDGFYQCVAGPGGGQERRSFDTDITVSTWVTEDEQTAATTNGWSPGSTPAVTKAEQVTMTSAVPLERVSTCLRERHAARPRATGVVGVAF